MVVIEGKYADVIEWLLTVGAGFTGGAGANCNGEGVAFRQRGMKVGLIFRMMIHMLSTSGPGIPRAIRT